MLDVVAGKLAEDTLHWSWLSVLAGPGLVFRSKSQPHVWYLSCGSIEDRSNIAWQLTETKVDGKVYFCPVSASSNPRPLHSNVMTLITIVEPSTY